MIDLLKGYGKTLGQYLKTAKGRHDVFDYGRAIGIIILVCAGLIILLGD